MKQVQGLFGNLKALGVTDRDPAAVLASAAEFILEGLYAQKRISRSEEMGFFAEAKPQTAGLRRAAQAAARLPAPVQLGGAAMRSINYSRYTGEDLDVDAESLHAGSGRLPARKRLPERILQ